MITLRKHVLPSILALVLLSTSACTSGVAAGIPSAGIPSGGTPSGTPSKSGGGTSQSAAPAESASPSAAVPQLTPASTVDARTVLAAFKSRDMVGHLQALQRVADANGGNRASGTPGYEESARYVEEQLRAAGYEPVRQSFTFKEDGRRGKTVETFNILAETGGSAGHTVVVGAHLDSVEDGPGINDNGSGVAAILETAKWMKEKGITPVNRVVFAFWGAEENDLDGSRHYVNELSKAGKEQTAAYLNVDMAASPNGVRSFHDGDGSDFGDAGPKGSDGIEAVFERYFKENSLPAETTPFEDGDSDYDPFLRAGIPGGGLFTGEEKKKTKAQVQAYGGVAGKVLDSCYHKACDTVSNINADLFKEMSGAMAYATATYAMAKTG
ncbi:M20/M25/M40 family metallo-hydrolase [Arthrobacter sp. NicSoilC12]|uniref:M20/M25/M40 family metallo-hydrolase n=1 Tax=Arthrobacter sp. NicSoilC12 TaxID=2831001 RepID=UPI001CC607B1|nr:M20/M25/M40 family metallo-hydrolase [Arthrobacter sp. NicSoilC12]GIU56108.1 aminopeptidase [Arthrobacter sp. NicSoilC12]